MNEFWDKIVIFTSRTVEIFTYELFSIGDKPISLSSLLFIIFALLLLGMFSSWLKRLLTNRIVKRYEINPGTVHSIATIVRYAVLILGSIIILQSSGIDLSSLGILAGALGVGIGFGLQNITNNFISGLIILFEQPIKVGDRVTVGEIQGNIVKIAPRATTLVTNDNVTLIIPNSEFISNTVTNWSHNDQLVGLRYPFGVSYNADPEHVRRVVLEVLDNKEGILKDPKPDVLFDGFGDSSLDFNILLWTTAYTSRPVTLKSELYYEIFKKFKEEGIEIPFPQRDLHIRSSEPIIKTSASND